MERSSGLEHLIIIVYYPELGIPVHEGICFSVLLTHRISIVQMLMAIPLWNLPFLFLKTAHPQQVAENGIVLHGVMAYQIILLMSAYPDLYGLNRISPCIP